MSAPGVAPPELEERRRERTAGIVHFLADLIQAQYAVRRQDAVIAASVLGEGHKGLRELWQHAGWPRKRLTSTFVKLCIGAVEGLAR